MHRLGLTGGIGSGKSTVAALLAARGAVVVDADLIARATTAAGGAAIPAIASEFGQDSIRDDGSMDRERMRTMVFTDSSARDRLENILHPIVGVEIERQIDVARTRAARCVVIEIPLLLESGRWRTRLHRIVTVDCSVEEQIRRVTARSDLAATEIRRIIAAQAAREKRLSASDLVIRNDRDSMRNLEHQVMRVADHFGL